MAFRASLDIRYDALKDFEQDACAVFDGKTSQDTFIQIMVYGLYLQLKTL